MSNSEGLFRSFLIGGFEGSTHRRRDGRQLDLIAATGHDRLAEADYATLNEHRIGTARDALRWHLIESTPGSYDWSSWLPMLEAANRTGTQVIWDLCHYGIPPDLDIWSPDFVPRLGTFAAAAAEIGRNMMPAPRIWCPMNEISFWAWAGGSTGHIYPFATGQGPALKRQLVSGAIAATRAIRAVDPLARFVQPEPMIHIIGHPDRPRDAEPAEGHRLTQFEAWDMLAGRVCPELGGSEDLLDVVGGNFYFNNQWVHEFETMAMGHRLFRPFQDMLVELWQRYGRSILIAETGAEGRNGPGWLRYVAGEVEDAMAQGVPVLGISLYPVLDYPGWDDERHCGCGLIAASPDWSGRSVHAYMARQIEWEQERFSSRDARRTLWADAPWVRKAG